jgi:hypothetical protein
MSPKPDFNQWCESMDITIPKQSSNMEGELIIFEALYDLILDLQRRKEDKK